MMLTLCDTELIPTFQLQNIPNKHRVEQNFPRLMTKFGVTFFLISDNTFILQACVENQPSNGSAENPRKTMGMFICYTLCIKISSPRQIDESMQIILPNAFSRKTKKKSYRNKPNVSSLGQE